MYYTPPVSTSAKFPVKVELTTVVLTPALNSKLCGAIRKLVSVSYLAPHKRCPQVPYPMPGAHVGPPICVAVYPEFEYGY
jgi:hypothetical protein